MENKDLAIYYGTVLEIACQTVGFMDRGKPINEDMIASCGARNGFNRTAFVEDVKAVTNIITARRNADIKFDTPNDNETNND